MMTKRILIHDSTGANMSTAELPGDVPVKELIPALTSKLNLPMVGPDGRPFDYHLYHQDRRLRGAETLNSAGVLDDAAITIVLEATAGCFPAGTQITLADKTKSRIEDVKPGDRVLSYDAEKNRFEAGTVKRLLADQASKCLVINGTFRVTESHLLYLDGEWRPARNVRVGNLLATQSGRPIEVLNVHTEDVQGPVYNLHLLSRSHTFFAEGVLVHNADEKLAYDAAHAAPEGFDFSIEFDSRFSPDEVKSLLTALADYYRACGGAGFELDFELQEASVREPIHA